MRFRRLGAIGLLAAAVAGCSSDPRDIKLSEMNQPEHAAPDERELLARYVATNARSLDYKLTVGEVLKVAAEERDAREKERIAAIEAQMQRDEEQRKAAEAEREARLSAVLDRYTVAQAQAPAGAQILNELRGLIMMSIDPNGGLEAGQPMTDFILLTRYLRTDLADGQATLRDAYDHVRSDPAAVETEIRAAEARREQELRLVSVLDHRHVRAYLMNPAVQQEAADVLPAEDIALLGSYLPPREQIPVMSPVLNMTLRQALDSARQGQSVATAGRP
jgi:hypothetical protein